MILDYYRIFYYVAQYKSFSKAADVMGNNQPNITRCMNILENELGCKLFIRSNRGVQLTIEGERLFEHVSIAIEQLVSGENELLKDKGLESGLVNIGASEIALRLFLLNELEVFHHRYPHVKLRISNHSTPQAVPAEIRLYENIVDEEKGVYNEDGSLNLNPNSLTVLKNCVVEENLKDAKAYDSFQFVRQGFFCVDAKDSTADHLVFNRIVSLKSSFKLPNA